MSPEPGSDIKANDKRPSSRHPVHEKSGRRDPSQETQLCIKCKGDCKCDESYDCVEFGPPILPSHALKVQKIEEGYLDDSTQSRAGKVIEELREKGKDHHHTDRTDGIGELSLRSSRIADCTPREGA